MKYRQCPDILYHLRQLFSLMSLTPENLVFPICIAAVVLFGVWALFMTYRFQRSDLGKSLDTEFFLTARGTQPWYRVAWGLFATSVGSGVIFGPAAFALFAGWVALITYPFFAGFPLIIVAYMGSIIRERFPRPMSIASYARWRFGPFMEILVTLNVLLNLGVAMSVEYTAIGALFAGFLNVQPWIPIVTVGLVTMAYTIAGGLFVSILTDQVQSIFMFILILVVSIFLGVNFRPGTLPAVPEGLGVTDVGLGSFATLGVAIISSTIFSDAVWQRIWSAKDEKALKLGSFVAMLLTMIVTFYFAFFGYLAGWLGLVDLSDPVAVNSAFFSILKPSAGGEVPLSMLAVIMLLAATMNEAAIDSYQNGILDSILSVFYSFGLKVPLFVARLTVILINVPIMWVGTQGYNIISLYLITNLLTTCFVIPLCLGLFKTFDKYVSESSVFFGCLFSLLSVMVQGYIQFGDFWSGIQNYFYLNYYWQAFVCGLVASVVGVALFVGIEILGRKVLGKEQFEFKKPLISDHEKTMVETDTEF